ncbi:MAG: DUF1116 domain-containing protein [Armatimonadetes bacterium]|nr:DUF1116 domain-containing protein [Armatimonadota bacterium]
MTTSLADRIDAANAEALRRIESADPVLVGLRAARDVIPPLHDRALLHAGPPAAPEDFCGPMRGAALGAMVYEGWAATQEAAGDLLARGAVTLHCTHDWGVVGPMAGIVSPSMPLLEIADRAHGLTAYAPINEGIGPVLRFGAYNAAVLARLRWLQDVLAPALDGALRRMGGLPLVPVMARALTMGDEMHQRNVAASSLFYRAVAPALAEGDLAGETLASVLRFLADNDQFFLNLAMAAAKAVMTSVREIPYCTVVSVMSRNGVEFGIRVSGLGDRWFTAPAPTPSGLYFPGFTGDDANPDMGDSAIIEALGLGGFAMAAAPAVVGFVGLPAVGEALTITRTMGEITVGRSTRFKIPALEFEGAPTGIDARRVVRLEVTPVINTGIAHRQPGVGQIGAGVVRAPLAVFQEALAAFATQYAEGAADAESA